MKKKKWSEIDIEFLIENYARFGPKYCANQLGRTITSIYLKSNKLKLKKVKKWSEFDIDFLKKNYNILGVKGCMIKLDRSNKSITMMAHILKLGLYTTEYFIIRSNDIHNNTYDYSKFTYINSHTKSGIICNKHGEFQQTPDSHLKGRGCPICNESKGEKLIRLFLEDGDINYSPQHTFDDCRNINKLPFDFYLPKDNICIEFNGRQHYEPIEWFGGQTVFNKLQKRDKIKKEYCLNNGLTLLEIRYDDDIINKLEVILETT